MRARTAAFIALLTLAGVAPAAAAAVAPWPQMRHDLHNTGVSPLIARYPGGRPWTFATGRGIFSTPVIGADGTIYVGSADTWFYAIHPTGRLQWKFKTGGIIDAAAALSPYNASLRAALITFGSGDAYLYHVTAPARGRPRVLWRFRATKPPVPGQEVDWWEGDVAIGPNGDIYAGNTGGTAYALTSTGHLVWTFTGGNSLWTEPAFGPNGSTFWGSLDFNAYRLDASGHPAWGFAAPGYFVSSPAIGSDGTVYIGSFDSELYALDPSTGKPRWSFATSDHLYASPALGHDADGRTDAIYIASADGSVYAVSSTGRLLWRYDTGDPIRSSPVLGGAPGGGEILYLGSSNGKLYALNAATGHRRWSYDTTPANPVLRDRNDLNASPALGRTGVVIAGEDGNVDYVPYDYCLHRRDPRCDTNPGEDLGANVDRVFPVTSGGTTLPVSRLTGVSPATLLNLRLVVRRHGRTVNAAVLDPASAVTITPSVSFTVQESGDGHFLYVVPRGLLRAGTTYRLRVRGQFTDNGPRMGNFNPAGTPAGSFDQTITVRTARAAGALPLSVGPRRVSALTISRLAVPMPAFLPSVNQIGFDSYDWIATTIARTRSHVLLWVIGARRDARGVAHVQPGSAFSFPLFGTYRGRAVALASPAVSLEFSFGPVPLRRYVMRGTLTPQLSFRPGAALYAETVCATVPHYGPELVFTGICNPSGVLAASGTFLGSAYRGAAATRPAGLRIGNVTLDGPVVGRAGHVDADLAGGPLPAESRHVASLLLVDAASGAPVALDYHADTSLMVSRHGRIRAVRLALPAGTVLPHRLRLYVVVDGFPLGSRLF